MFAMLAITRNAAIQLMFTGEPLQKIAWINMLLGVKVSGKDVSKNMDLKKLADYKVEMLTRVLLVKEI